MGARTRPAGVDAAAATQRVCVEGPAIRGEEAARADIARGVDEAEAEAEGRQRMRVCEKGGRAPLPTSATTETDTHKQKTEMTTIDAADPALAVTAALDAARAALQAEQSSTGRPPSLASLHARGIAAARAGDHAGAAALFSLTLDTAAGAGLTHRDLHVARSNAAASWLALGGWEQAVAAARAARDGAVAAAAAGRAHPSAPARRSACLAPPSPPGATRARAWPPWTRRWPWPPATPASGPGTARRRGGW